MLVYLLLLLHLTFFSYHFIWFLFVAYLHNVIVYCFVKRGSVLSPPGSKKRAPSPTIIF